MIGKDVIYEAFSELLYAVLMVDGVVDAEEQAAIQTLLNDHPLANYVEFQFQNQLQEVSLVQSYKTISDLCVEHGPDPEYPYLVEVLEAVSAMSHVTEAEKEHTNILHTVVEAFKNRIQKLNATLA